MPFLYDLHCKKAFCGFRQHGCANRQSAFIEIEPWMMQKVFFMPLFLRAEREHRPGRMFHELTEVLSTESLVKLMYIFHPKQLPACFFNDFGYHVVINDASSTE